MKVMDKGQRTMDSGRMTGLRTKDVGQRHGLWAVGCWARILALVLCPLSFVLVPSAQAEDHAITVNVGQTSTVQTYQYTHNNVVQERWFKLAGGDGETATAQFAPANPEESRMSASSCALAEFTFTGVKAGTTKWTIYTYTDAPPYKSGKSYPAYGTADGTTGSWSKKDTYTITVTNPVEPPIDPPPVDPSDPTQISYTGDVEKKTVDGEEVYIFKSGTCTLTLPQDVLADILVVGGGGGGGPGGSSQAGTGGKGGTVVYRPDEILTAGVLNVAVGAGGSAGSGQGSGGNGTKSSLGTIEAVGGTGGARKGAKSGSNGSGYGQYDITGTPTDYGMGGNAGSGSSAGAAGAPNTGKGGQGGASGSKAGGAGGSGVVIVRILRTRMKIAVPTAAQGLVWGITNQVGVAAGEGYTRGGTYEASAIGEYTATVTPDDDHCWPDLTRDTKTIEWSIARRPAKVTVIDATKAPNDPEPYFHTKNEGFLAADTTELVWTAWRTNTDETVGTYDVVILGEKEQSGYDITYVGNTLTIENAPVGPSIPEDEGEITYDPETKEVVVTPKDETVTEVEIIDMPADGTVKVPVSVGTIKGVEPGQVVEVFYTAPAGAGGKTYDITPAFTISGDKGSGVTIELNETASVMFDLGDGRTDTITVTPTLTETGDEAVAPFEVATEEVDVGVKTIPGLTYALKRSAEPGTVREGKVVDEKQAEGLRTKLTDPMDGGKPEKAFYIIEVKK